MGFPRPPNQRSQSQEDAPWRPLLRAGGKQRCQTCVVGFGLRAAGPQPPSPVKGRVSPGGLRLGGACLSVCVRVCARVRVLERQPHRSALCEERRGSRWGMAGFPLQTFSQEESAWNGSLEPLKHRTVPWRELPRGLNVRMHEKHLTLCSVFRKAFFSFSFIFVFVFF